MAAAIAQTIAVVDKSGKVVSTVGYSKNSTEYKEEYLLTSGQSKQLKNVFMEAKFAYQERKAEIVAERKVKATGGHQQDLRRVVTDLPMRDAASERSHPSTRHRSHRRRESGRPGRADGLGRQHSSCSLDIPRPRYDDDNDRRSSALSPRSPPTDWGHRRGSAPTSPTSPTPDGNRRSLSLVRRRTDLDLVPGHHATRTRHRPARSISEPGVDIDLAYGDYHPDSIAPLANTDAATEKEFITLVERAKLLLDEAQCAQYSVQAMIAHLQKNPEAMAAVALTLAEISNLATKMAPGALTMLKGSSPAVFALLASPQFLIAAGVGIGVTVVMFGGYKIIKKIKAKNEANREGSMDEMVELDGDEFTRIQKWRRGIVGAGDDNAGSAASLRLHGPASPSDTTSVDGEFITPLAASMRGMETRDDLSRLSDRERTKRDKKVGKESKKEKELEKKKKKKSKSKSKSKSTTGRETDGETVSDAGSGTGSTVVSSSSSSPSAAQSRLSPVQTAKRALVKVKRPSPLRRLLS